MQNVELGFILFVVGIFLLGVCLVGFFKTIKWSSATI